MTVTGRKHNMDDIIATVLAVEPMKFIYRGRIAVFSVRVLRDERICIVAEQRPDCGEEEVLLHSSGLKAKAEEFFVRADHRIYILLNSFLVRKSALHYNLIGTE